MALSSFAVCFFFRKLRKQRATRRRLFGQRGRGEEKRELEEGKARQFHCCDVTGFREKNAPHYDATKISMNKKIGFRCFLRLIEFSLHALVRGRLSKICMNKIKTL